jgi:hypothetical protein
LPTSIVALELLLILLPGFAAAYIVQLLALRATQTDFDKVIETCLYSCLIYASFVLLAHGALPFDVIPPKPPATDTILSWHPNRLLGMVVLTVVWSLAGAIYINRDGNWLFRKMNITERTTRRSIWNDIFQREAASDQIVQVELADGRSILGVLKYYSDSAEDSSLYISQAAWVGEDGKAISIPGPGILLTKSANIQSISLLDPAKE